MWLSKEDRKLATARANAEYVKKWNTENPEKAKQHRKRAQENFIENNPERWKEIQRKARLKRMKNPEYKNMLYSKQSLRDEYNRVFGKPKTVKEYAERSTYIEKNLENRIEEIKYSKLPEVKKAKKEKFIKEHRKVSRDKYRSKSIEERKLENKRTWIGKKRRSAIDEFKKINSENEVHILSAKEIRIPNSLQNLALLSLLTYKHGEYLKIEEDINDTNIILTFIEREDYLEKYVSENIANLKKN